METINKGGARFYVSESETVPSVTSIVGMEPKPFLQAWSAKMAAELAIESLPFVEQMAKADKQGAIDYLKGASRRYTAERSRVGSEAHDMFERQIRGVAPGYVASELIPYRDHFDAFLQATQPELVRAEETVWNSTHAYAGSFDAILLLHLDEDGKPDAQGEPSFVVADWKTSKSIYASVALQMSAYRNAETIVAADDSESTMPELDGGVVLHVTPAKWSLVGIRTDKIVFDHFLALRETFRWQREVQRSVIGGQIVGSTGFVTGTERRGK